MSVLEGDLRDVLKALATDVPLELQPIDQRDIARWAVKKAMLLEFTREAGSRQFYSEAERRAIVSPQGYPDDTLVWLGRWAGDRGLAASARTYDDVAHCTTMLVGKLVLQVLTIRLPATTPGSDGTLHLRQQAAQHFGPRTVRIRDLPEAVRWPPSASLGPDLADLQAFGDRFTVDSGFVGAWRPARTLGDPPASAEPTPQPTEDV